MAFKWVKLVTLLVYWLVLKFPVRILGGGITLKHIASMTNEGLLKHSLLRQSTKITT